MTLNDNLENELQQLGKAIGSDESLTRKVVSRIDKPAPERQRKTISLIREITMNRFAKLAAAAAIIIGLIVWSKIPSSVVPTAYALQDTIEAGNSIRFLHIKASSHDKYGSSDTWLQYDEHGNVVRMRFQAPHLGDAVGPLVVVNNYDKSQVWLEKFNLYITGYDKTDPVFGFDVSTIEPRYLLGRLRQQAEQGGIILDINEPAQKNEPIAVTITYPEDHRSHEYKKVLYVDQATKLVTSIEKFKFENGKYQHVITLEFFDYNQQIDAMMFSLDGEVTDNAMLIEMPEDAEAGLVQGDMTDEEISVEVIRQFYEAIIAKDYDKAGLLYLAAPGFMVEKGYSGVNVIEITDISQARRDPDPDSDAMFCSCKALAEIGGELYEVDSKWMKVQRFDKDYGRWMLAGNWTSVNPASGQISISKDNATLEAVTYYGLEPEEFMQNWLILEPIRIEVRGDTMFPSEETQKEYFDTEQVDVTQFEPVVNFDGNHYEWSALENEYGVIDLTSVYEDWYLVTYLWAQIDMPEETKGTLGIGSDDGVKVWLNGEIVHENWTVRGVAIDNDRVPVTFKKGMNQLVLKIQNQGGPWGFCCRLLEE